MKPTRTARTAGLILWLACVTGRAQAQSVFNGSFEIGTDPNAGAGQNIGMFAWDDTTISGWTLASGSIDYIGDRWLAGDGGRSLDLSGISPGSVFQSIAGFTPGVAYELSFLMAGNPEGGALTKSLRVDIGGASQVFSFTGPGSPSAMGWAVRTLEFTATAPTLTLTFTSLEDNASGPALDQVRIAVVPEPSAWCLLLVGAMAVGYRSRTWLPMR